MIRPISLHVERRGQGFPILCLHGHPGSGQAMEVFITALAPHYRTLAPDLRGYGRSRVREPFPMAAHVADLEALLEREGIERCFLLGWSLGGILAMELALRSPHRYAGLILIGTAARPRGKHPPVSPGELAATGIAALLNGIKPGWMWNINTFGQRSLLRHLIHQQHPIAYRYLAQVGTAAYLKTSRHAHRALNHALSQGYNRLGDLPQLTMPALMIAGAKDVHITAAASEETAATLPHCDWHCIPDTAHLLPWETPQTITTLILSWLGGRQEGRPTPPQR